MTALAFFVASPSAAQIANVTFGTEYVPAGLSPAARQRPGVVVEAQAQTLPGLRSPTGLVLSPIVPRLSAGVAQPLPGGWWTVGASGAVVVSGDGGDRGTSWSLGGGAAWASPGGAVWLGPALTVDYLAFRSLDDRHRRFGATLELASGFRLHRRLDVLFRMGAAGALVRSDTRRRGLRTEHLLEPRFVWGVDLHASPRIGVTLLSRFGVRELIPRVPSGVVVSLRYRAARNHPPGEGRAAGE